MKDSTPMFYCTLDAMPGLYFAEGGTAWFAPAETDTLHDLLQHPGTLLVTAQVPSLLARHLYATQIATRQAVRP
jgi:hypothetical protein